MSDRRLLVGMAVAAVVLTGAALAVGAAADRDPAPTPPGFGPGPVTEATPRIAAWREVVADLEPGLDPGSPNPCQAGRLGCLDVVIGEMRARHDALGCAHTAPFALTYLVTTEAVDEGVRDGTFADPAGVAHLDAVFARLYFDAFDNWEAGRRDEVPGAWQMAFAAADARRSSAAVDLLLGMNAHISRDLAFAVALVVEAAPELADDPGDYRRVNDVLRDIAPAMVDLVAERYDPRMAELEDDVGVDPDLDVAGLFASWRDAAFDLGVRLARAPTEAERTAVAAEIERASVAAATVVLNADAVGDLGLGPEERRAHCEAPR